MNVKKKFFNSGTGAHNNKTRRNKIGHSEGCSNSGFSSGENDLIGIDVFRVRAVETGSFVNGTVGGLIIDSCLSG